MKISDIDSNLKVKTDIQADNAVLKSCLAEPFEIRGLSNPKETGNFYRVSETVFPLMSEDLRYLSKCTAGGRIRFRTDSPYVIVNVELTENTFMPHMPVTGISGVDIYIGAGENCKYKQTVIPPSHQLKEYEGICYLPVNGGALIDITLNLPLYNGINNLYIGLKDGSTVEKPTPYVIDKPIVYYGSSITQGGCASRPGNSYNAIVSRWLDCDHINLGFSGNGRGEIFMAEYIAGTDMSAFVMDYDHNAPDENHLRATHEPFFKVIRANQPNVPVIFISMPNYDPKSPSCIERREIIRQTYTNAINDGDQNVYFIGGETMFGVKDRDACTVDGAHPNDFGFMRMAEAVYPVLKKALNS
jgi:hypothetical protein